MIRRLIILTVLVLLVALAGGGLWSFVLAGQHDTVLSLTSFSVSVITFFGVMSINQPKRGLGPLTKGSIRSAIASSVLVTYLYMLSFTTFIKTPTSMSSITESYINTFSNLVGVTIAFYFGASAAVQIFGKEDSLNQENDDEPVKKEK